MTTERSLSAGSIPLSLGALAGQRKVRWRFRRRLPGNQSLRLPHGDLAVTRWMLTGGAGYIGSHVLRQLLAVGIEVVVVDDLSSGLASRVPDGVPLVQANVCDRPAMVAAMRDSGVDGVIHFAAKKAVGESVERPLYYYRENVDGVIALLEAMEEVGVGRFVYSSSAAVYGEPTMPEVPEEAPLIPTSPYGETKVIGEWATRASAVARRNSNHPLSFVLLRYFNVAGAGSDDLGDTSVANLVPLALRAVSAGERPKIFGTDYPTPDGTCVRDYIHVVDLAAAHVSAVNLCDDRPLGDVGTAFNVGTGSGSSVREVIDMVSEVVGFDANPEATARREGDPAALIAAVGRINRELGWTAEFGLRDMVSSAWSAWPTTARE